MQLTNDEKHLIREKIKARIVDKDKREYRWQSEASNQLALSVMRAPSDDIAWKEINEYLADASNQKRALYSRIQMAINDILLEAAKSAYQEGRYQEAIDKVSGSTLTSKHYGTLVGSSYQALGQYDVAYTHFTEKYPMDEENKTLANTCLASLVRDASKLDFIKGLIPQNQKGQAGRLVLRSAENGVSQIFGDNNQQGSGSSLLVGGDPAGTALALMILVPVTLTAFAVSALIGTALGLANAASRKFLSVEEQKLLIDRLHALTQLPEEEKQHFIQNIASKYSREMSFRSSNSSEKLILTLQNAAMTLDSKIDNVISYMLSRNSAGFYGNNGKRLFLLIANSDATRTSEPTVTAAASSGGDTTLEAVRELNGDHQNQQNAQEQHPALAATFSRLFTQPRDEKSDANSGVEAESGVRP